MAATEGKRLNLLRIVGRPGTGTGTDLRIIQESDRRLTYGGWGRIPALEFGGPRPLIRRRAGLIQR